MDRMEGSHTGSQKKSPTTLELPQDKTYRYESKESFIGGAKGAAGISRREKTKKKSTLGYGRLNNLP